MVTNKSAGMPEKKDWETENIKRYLRLKGLINSRLKKHEQYLLTQLNSTYLHLWAIKCLSQSNYKRVANEISEESLRVSQLNYDDFSCEFIHHPTPDSSDWYEYAIEIGYDDSDD
jgi:hypothetical protein